MKANIIYSSVNSLVSIFMCLQLMLCSCLFAENVEARIITFHPGKEVSEQSRVGFMNFAPQLTFNWNQAKVVSPKLKEQQAQADIIERPSYWLVLLDISDTGRLGGVKSEINLLIDFIEDLPSSHYVKLVPFALYTHQPKFNFELARDGYIHIGSHRESFIAWLKKYKQSQNWQKDTFYHAPNKDEKLDELNTTHISVRVSQSIASFIKSDFNYQSSIPAAYKVLLITDAKDEDRQKEQAQISGLCPYNVLGSIDSDTMKTQAEFYILSEASFVNVGDKTPREKFKFREIAKSCQGHFFYNETPIPLDRNTVQQDSNRAEMLEELAGRYLSSGKIVEIDIEQMGLAAFANDFFSSLDTKLSEIPITQLSEARLQSIVQRHVIENPYTFKLELQGDDGQRAYVELTQKQLYQLFTHIFKTGTENATIKYYVRLWLIMYHLNEGGSANFNIVFKLLIDIDVTYISIDITKHLKALIAFFINRGAGESTDAHGWEIFKLAMILVENELNRKVDEKKIGEDNAAACFFYAQILSGETVEQVKATETDPAKAIRLMTYSLKQLKENYPSLYEQACIFLIGQFEKKLNELKNGEYDNSFDLNSLKIFAQYHSEGYWLMTRYYLTRSSLTKDLLNETAQALKLYLLAEAQKPGITIKDEHMHAYSLLISLCFSTEFVSGARREEYLAGFKHIVNERAFKQALQEVNSLLSEAVQIEIATMLADTTPAATNQWRSKIKGMPEDYQNEAMLVLARYYYIKRQFDLARFYYKLLDAQSYVFSGKDYNARVALGLLQREGDIAQTAPTYITEAPKAPTNPLGYILCGVVGTSACFMLGIYVNKKRCARAGSGSCSRKAPLAVTEIHKATQHAYGYLYVHELDGGTLFSLPYNDKAYTLGRQIRNDICVNHASISKFHLVIYPDAQGNWNLQDLKSANRISVNNTKLNHVKLDNTLSFKLGNVLFTYYHASASDTGFTHHPHQ